MKSATLQPIEQTGKTLSFQFDPNRLIRLREVLQLVPVAASTWWLWVKEGKAPQPVRLGERCTCWRYSDVIALAEGKEV
jgi:predicted DNA-binding transcriptional regulator AlpA